MTVGAMEALLLTFMVGIDPGDEVLITDPSYTNFEGQITLAGGRPIFVPTDPERGYLPHAEDVAAAVTPRTRAILVNSPSNPTGAVYPRDLLHAIAEICVRHDLLLVSDETYGALTYGDIRNVSPASFPGLRDRTVSIHSFSKEYAMTGWRIGYLTGPALDASRDGRRPGADGLVRQRGDPAGRPRRRSAAPRTASRRCAAPTSGAGTWSSSGSDGSPACAARDRTAPSTPSPTCAP